MTTPWMFLCLVKWWRRSMILPWRRLKMMPQSVTGAIALMWQVQAMTWQSISKWHTLSPPLLFSLPPARRSFVHVMTVERNSSWTRHLQCTFTARTNLGSGVITVLNTFLDAKNWWRKYTRRCVQCHALPRTAAPGTPSTLAHSKPWYSLFQLTFIFAFYVSRWPRKRPSFFRKS